MTKFTFATSKEGFDNHIDTSVRGYSQLWGDILSLSKYFVEDYTQVVDMGCSSGKLLKGMIEQNQKHIPHAQYTCLLYTSPSPRDLSTSRMPSSA